MRHFVSPFFLTRHLLRRTIRSELKKRGLSGSVIDFGCGEKPHRDLFESISVYHGIDFSTFSRNNDFSGGSPDFLFGDDYLISWRTEFEDQTYDNAVAFEVIEHHPRPDKLLSEMYRVVKGGGYCLLTWPFIFPIHEGPHDYLRISEFGFNRLAADAGFEVLGVTPTGGLIPSVVTLLSANVAFGYDRGGWWKIAALTVYPAVLALQYLALLLPRVGSRTVLSYVAVIRKR